MTPEQEKEALFEHLLGDIDFLSTKTLTNIHLDLIQIAARVIANVKVQVGDEQTVKACSALKPGMKCEVNFIREGFVSDYWQIATVLETDGLRYRTSATTDWVEASRVRVPQA